MWHKRFREVFQVCDKDKLQNVGKLCLVHRLNFKITHWGGFGYHAIKLYCMRGKNPKMLQCDIYACPICGFQISRWCDQREEKYNTSSVSHLTLQQKIWHGESIPLAIGSVPTIYFLFPFFVRFRSEEISPKEGSCLIFVSKIHLERKRKGEWTGGATFAFLWRQREEIKEVIFRQTRQTAPLISASFSN